MCLCYSESELFEGVDDVVNQYPELIQWLDCEGGYCDRWFEHEQLLDE